MPDEHLEIQDGQGGAIIVVKQLSHIRQQDSSANCNGNTEISDGTVLQLAHDRDTTLEDRSETGSIVLLDTDSYSLVRVVDAAEYVLNITAKPDLLAASPATVKSISRTPELAPEGEFITFTVHTDQAGFNGTLDLSMALYKEIGSVADLDDFDVHAFDPAVLTNPYIYTQGSNEIHVRGLDFQNGQATFQLPLRVNRDISEERWILSVNKPVSKEIVDRVLAILADNDIDNDTRYKQYPSATGVIVEAQPQVLRTMSLVDAAPQEGEDLRIELAAEDATFTGVTQVVLRLSGDADTAAATPADFDLSGSPDLRFAKDTKDLFATVRFTDGEAELRLPLREDDLSGKDALESTDNETFTWTLLDENNMEITDPGAVSGKIQERPLIWLDFESPHDGSGDEVAEGDSYGFRIRSNRAEPTVLGADGFLLRLAPGAGGGVFPAFGDAVLSYTQRVGETTETAEAHWTAADGDTIRLESLAMTDGSSELLELRTVHDLSPQAQAQVSLGLHTAVADGAIDGYAVDRTELAFTHTVKEFVTMVKEIILSTSETGVTTVTDKSKFLYEGDEFSVTLRVVDPDDNKTDYTGVLEGLEWSTDKAADLALPTRAAFVNGEASLVIRAVVEEDSAAEEIIDLRLRESGYVVKKSGDKTVVSLSDNVQRMLVEPRIRQLGIKGTPARASELHEGKGNELELSIPYCFVGPHIDVLGSIMDIPRLPGVTLLAKDFEAEDFVPDDKVSFRQQRDGVLLVLDELEPLEHVAQSANCGGKTEITVGITLRFAQDADARADEALEEGIISLLDGDSYSLVAGDDRKFELGVKVRPLAVAVDSITRTAAQVQEGEAISFTVAVDQTDFSGTLDIQMKIFPQLAQAKEGFRADNNDFDILEIASGEVGGETLYVSKEDKVIHLRGLNFEDGLATFSMPLRVERDSSEQETEEYVLSVISPVSDEVLALVDKGGANLPRHYPSARGTILDAPPQTIRVMVLPKDKLEEGEVLRISLVAHTAYTGPAPIALSLGGDMDAADFELELADKRQELRFDEDEDNDNILHAIARFTDGAAMLGLPLKIDHIPGDEKDARDATKPEYFSFTLLDENNQPVTAPAPTGGFVAETAHIWLEQIDAPDTNGDVVFDEGDDIRFRIQTNRTDVGLVDTDGFVLHVTPKEIVHDPLAVEGLSSPRLPNSPLPNKGKNVLSYLTENEAEHSVGWDRSGATFLRVDQLWFHKDGGHTELRLHTAENEKFFQEDETVTVRLGMVDGYVTDTAELTFKVLDDEEFVSKFPVTHADGYTEGDDIKWLLGFRLNGGLPATEGKMRQVANALKDTLSFEWNLGGNVEEADFELPTTLPENPSSEEQDGGFYAKVLIPVATDFDHRDSGDAQEEYEEPFTLSLAASSTYETATNESLKGRITQAMIYELAYHPDLPENVGDVTKDTVIMNACVNYEEPFLDPQTIRLIRLELTGNIPAADITFTTEGGANIPFTVESGTGNLLLSSAEFTRYTTRHITSHTSGLCDWSYYSNLVVRVKRTGSTRKGNLKLLPNDITYIYKDRPTIIHGPREDQKSKFPNTKAVDIFSHP